MSRISPTPNEPVVIGPRRPRTPKQREAILAAQAGVCGRCGLPLALKGMELDHRLPIWISGDDSDANMVALHRRCHVEKTVFDKGDIAKAKRRQSMLVGAERKPSRLKSRNEWPKGRKMQSRGFGK